MIKYCFMIISLILSTFVFCGDDHTTDSGTVTIKCNHVNTKSYKGDSLTSYYTYSNNEKGNIVTDTFFGPDSSIKRITYFFYDSRDSVIRWEERDPGGDLISYRNFSFDSKGLLLEKTIWTKDSVLRIREEYVYDGNGNEIERRQFDLSGKLISRSMWEVSSGGIYLSYKAYDSTGNLSSMTLNITDAKGNTTESRSLNPDSSLKFYSLYKYNSKGLTIESKTFQSDSSLLSWSRYEYNQTGKMTRGNTLNEDGVTTNSLELIYDLNNNLVEMISWSNGTVRSRTIYEFNCFYK